MKYTVAASQSIENLIHNIKKIDEHIEFKEILGEFDNNYSAMIKIQDEMFRQLGQWYFIERTKYTRYKIHHKTKDLPWKSPLITAKGGYAR